MMTPSTIHLPVAARVSKPSFCKLKTRGSDDDGPVGPICRSDWTVTRWQSSFPASEPRESWYGPSLDLWCLDGQSRGASSRCTECDSVCVDDHRKFHEAHRLQYSSLSVKCNLHGFPATCGYERPALPTGQPFLVKETNPRLAIKIPSYHMFKYN